MPHDPSYRTIDEKVQDAERYLIRRVDSIRRLVMVAVLLSAIAVAASLWNTLGPTSRTQRDVATTTAPSGERTLGGGGFSAPPRPVSSPEVEPAPAATSTERTDGEAAESVLVATSVPVGGAFGGAVSSPPDAAAPVADDAPTVETDAPAAPSERDALPPVSSEIASSDLVTDTSGDVPVPIAPVNPQPPAGSDWAFTIGASAVATEIIDLEPVGVATRFSGELPQLYCWTRIETDDFDAIPQASRYVIHRWIYNDNVFRERTITIGSARYRVYSALGTPGDYPGEWRVEVVDARGTVIGDLSFRIVS